MDTIFNKSNMKKLLAIIFLTLLLTIIFAVMLFGVLVVNVKGLDNAIAFLLDRSKFGDILYTLIFVVSLIVITFIYYNFEDKEFSKKISNAFLVFGIIIVSVICCYAVSLWQFFLRPYALCALLSLFLVGRRFATFNNIVFSLLMLIVDSVAYGSVFDYSIDMVISLFLNVIVGIIAIFLVDGNGSRLKVLSMGIIISLPVVVVAACYEALSGTEVIIISLISALGSGILADILMTAILPFFESAFKVLTDFRLSELTDHKSKILKQFAERAPGTFNHTVIVAMLAETCSSAIGENPLLARACAYYHDLGKMSNPELFTENQLGHNPHDELSPELSTEIIKAHAKDGAEFIRKKRLPEVLASAAEQHHGTMLIRYFYMEAKKYTDGVLDMEKFCYQGPKPKTKINAILMICDASEAKVRSVKDRTYENVDKAVKEIIEERMDADQFTECDITMKELNIIKNTITNSLAGVYHDRVKYPKLKIGNKNG